MTTTEVDTFPEVREVIRLRTAQVHGSYTNLANNCGISRQCLHGRISSATKWPNSHRWWVFVLFLHDPLDRLTSQEALQASVPSKEKVKSGLIGQEEVWQQCWKTRGTWDRWRKA